MRESSETLAATVSCSHTVSAEVAPFYAGQPIPGIDAIEIADGSLEIDGTRDVPGALSFTVPRYMTDPDTGLDLDLLPLGEGQYALGCSGTQVEVTYKVGEPGGITDAIGLGFYKINDWAENDDGGIDVNAVSLEQIVSEARFLTTAQISGGMTFPTAVDLVLEDLLPLEVNADPTRTAAAAAYEEDRLAALTDLVNAWPARMRVDDSGTLTIDPPWDDVADAPAIVLTDGENGTLVSAPHSGTRDGIYNAVRATGESDGDVAPVGATAYLATGPRAWAGPFGNVPYFYASPLLTTVAQCEAAARTRLINLQNVAEPVTIECLPDPRLEIGDVVELHRGPEVLFLRIDTIRLGLVATGGSMTIGTHEVFR